MMGLVLMAAELAELRAGYGPRDSNFDNVGLFLATRHEPSEGYSQHYADQMRTALLRIAQPVFINSKPAYADPDNVKAICDGLNERIKIAQDALLGLGKRTNASETQDPKT